MNPTDEELVRSHKEGDLGAFPELVDRYLSAVYNLALRQVSDSAEAEDIVQEVFLKVWKGLSQYREESASFKTWLMRIARNASIDFLRKRKHPAFSEFEDMEGHNTLTETLTDEEPRPEDVFDLALDAALVEASVARLPLSTREIIVLRYRHGLSFAEIAETLDESQNTVKSRHRRALAALRDMLAEHRNGG